MHHMIDRQDLFHNFQKILKGSWPIEATSMNGQVNGKRDIHIIVSHNGQQNNVILVYVFYIKELKNFLFPFFKRLLNQTC
jgi:hypothetical protein